MSGKRRHSGAGDGAHSPGWLRAMQSVWAVRPPLRPVASPVLLMAGLGPESDGPGPALSPSAAAVAADVSGSRVAVVIPVWNEAAAIGRVVSELPPGIVDEVLVVDGGSTDGTQEAARAAGATVLAQEGKGYGAACLTGARHATAGLLVFLDGDYSDPPAQIERLLTPLRAGRAGLVLGSRERGQMEAGALPLHARLGNRLAVALLRLLFRRRVSDLPSYKAIRRDDLLSLGIRDLHYGWTAEMIARAARRRLRIVEVPIDYRVRIGDSKVSGTLKGSVKAGYAILRAIVTVRFGND